MIDTAFFASMLMLQLGLDCLVAFLCVRSIMLLWR